MLEIFAYIATLFTEGVLGLDQDKNLTQTLHFFIESTTKIFALLIVLIYVIALGRASLNVERVRAFLAGKNRLLGYFLGSTFGAVTPFCSCSSVPVFIGFTSARIPIGITMAFLITSPMINEVAVVLLWGLLGWELTLLYVVVGFAVGMLGGAFLDAIRAERYLQPFLAKAYEQGSSSALAEPEYKRLSLSERHEFAKGETKEIFRRVWKWVFIGVGLGALLYGYVPDGWFEKNLGDGAWWQVPVAVLVGIPLYTNITGVVPVMESLILQGLPIGTTLAFCMSTVAASFPEFVLLKQVMQWRLLVIVFLMLLLAFTVAGWILNLVGPLLFAGV
ncbi:permease [Halorhodospira halochloris]|uniref:permease n=1 Tax=Halorhodospira halochloris TaxID=1052 RepID=UPI001EE88726|nr:permease [Halorhodospira halochloris]MCG5530142.1 permease [Halorhodospira halochloris]MCG5548000.1 permease [Halorhodospira halochloris]